MKLVWSSEARFQLLELRNFVAFDNPGAARMMIANIRAAAERLRDFPEAGRHDAELGTRILSIPRSPYRLHYQVSDGRIVIPAVWHGARQWPPASS